jgi:hypothetical protein
MHTHMYHLRAGLCLLSVLNMDLIRFVFACTIYSHHSLIFPSKYSQNSHTNTVLDLEIQVFIFLSRVWQPAPNYNGCLDRFKFKKRAPNNHYHL